MIVNRSPWDMRGRVAPVLGVDPRDALEFPEFAPPRACPCRDCQCPVSRETTEDEDR
jgi:hypothetical protein